MPKPLVKTPYVAPSLPAPELPARSVTLLGRDQVIWSESPARLLHERLVATFAAPPAPVETERTMSPRAKLAILVGSSAALWLVIGLAIAAVV